MAEILLTKLPHVYEVKFLREGVFHAVSALCAGEDSEEGDVEPVGGESNSATAAAAAAAAASDLACAAATSASASASCSSSARALLSAPARSVCAAFSIAARRAS
mmetsp:Transcript_15849/g.33893  ORF Transcript_15849/g.33893 Transcript_15849/m.33893 type:complete len:105 (-) Transcript_15849:328-642(-)